MTAATLGIDIGGTAVKVAVGGHDGWCLGTSDRYDRPSRGALRSAIGQAIERAGGVRDRGAVGLCVPGIPSADESRIEVAVNVPGLEGWAFDELIADAVGPPAGVRRTNDAAAATVDWVKSRGITGRIAGIAIGTGVGLSIVDDGVPVEWTDGGAGHLGQVDVTVGDRDTA
ncbi:MAG: ROK family protein, partial [Planctomycetota bacterium]